MKSSVIIHKNSKCYIKPSILKQNNISSSKLKITDSDAESIASSYSPQTYNNAYDMLSETNTNMSNKRVNNPSLHSSNLSPESIKNYISLKPKKVNKSLSVYKSADMINSYLKIEKKNKLKLNKSVNVNSFKAIIPKKTNKAKVPQSYSFLSPVNRTLTLFVRRRLHNKKQVKVKDTHKNKTSFDSAKLKRYETNEFDDIDEEIKSDYVAGFREHNNGYNKYRIECNEFSDDDSIFCDEEESCGENASDNTEERGNSILEMPSTKFQPTDLCLLNTEKGVLRRMPKSWNNEDEKSLSNNNLTRNLTKKCIDLNQTPKKNLAFQIPEKPTEPHKQYHKLINNSMMKKSLSSDKLIRHTKDRKESISSTQDTENRCSKRNQVYQKDKKRKMMSNEFQL